MNLTHFLLINCDTRAHNYWINWARRHEFVGKPQNLTPF